MDEWRISQGPARFQCRKADALLSRVIFPCGDARFTNQRYRLGGIKVFEIFRTTKPTAGSRAASGRPNSFSLPLRSRLFQRAGKRNNIKLILIVKIIPSYLPIGKSSLNLANQFTNFLILAVL